MAGVSNGINTPGWSLAVQIRLSLSKNDHIIDRKIKKKHEEISLINKSSTFLQGIKPRKKIILCHSSPQQSCGVSWKVLDKKDFKDKYKSA